MGLFLHEQIQRQGQQGIILPLLAVACHDKKQQDDQQIPGVKVPGQEIAQKSACALLRTLFAWRMFGRFLFTGILGHILGRFFFTRLFDWL